MAIGKRIVERLKTLGLKRKYLLDTIEDLTPQALSNLINRDSVRSEWDEKIASALGVSVLWLVYGKEVEPYPISTATALTANQTTGIFSLRSPQAHEVIEIMKTLTPDRQDEILAFARERRILQDSGLQNSSQRAGQ